MKFPNGFGSITKKKGHLRHPFMVRKTINGKQVFLGSFKTQSDALIFLANYNKEPHIYDYRKITFKEMYNLMAAERYPKIRESSARNYISVSKFCEPLFNKEFHKLRLQDLQEIIYKIKQQKCGYATQRKCRQLLHNIYQYAMKYEFVTTDYSKFIEIDKEPETKRKPFNKRQLNRVRKVISDNQQYAPWAMTVLMLCYSGVRPGEFVNIKKSDVKLHQRFFIIRESKTIAGQNRIVPISRHTLPYFEYWMAISGENLISENNHNVTYHRLKKQFDRVMKIARCKHSPHECRHTCATWLDDAGANEVAIRKILGHSIPGITKGVYTHKSLHELKKAIDLLKK